MCCSQATTRLFTGLRFLCVTDILKSGSLLYISCVVVASHVRGVFKECRAYGLVLKGVCWCGLLIILTLISTFTGHQLLFTPLLLLPLFSSFPSSVPLLLCFRSSSLPSFMPALPYIHLHASLFFLPFFTFPFFFASLPLFLLRSYLHSLFPFLPLTLCFPLLFFCQNSSLIPKHSPFLLHSPLFYLPPSSHSSLPLSFLPFYPSLVPP